MRNLFDQYDQPENKLTHALVCTLQSDRKLIRPFLSRLGIRGIPPMRQIQVVEQQVPGEAVSGNENESKGLPDACFYDNSDDNIGWAVLVESKVQAGISLNQLKRHAKTGKQYSFERSQVVLIAVDQPKKSLPEGAHSIEWRKVYGWFDKQASHSEWARRFVDYMRVFESQMIAKDYNIRGTITMFDGLHFDKKNPYTYREGKRLIKLFGPELQKRKDLHKLGVDPEGKRRPAITGSGQDDVWDFLSLKEARRAKQFTNYPHLTIGLNREYASAAITVPNGMKGGFRSNLKQNGDQGFQKLILGIEKRLRPIIQRTGAKPIIYVHQRHYATQRSPAETDAKLVADLRTLVRGSGSKVKYQPQWFTTIYEVLCHKGSNIQLGVEVQFPYDCKAIGSHKAADLFAKAWIAMSPLLDFVLDGK
jgi:hypothetical protein